jgi:hypothetical protein
MSDFRHTMPSADGAPSADHPADGAPASPTLARLLDQLRRAVSRYVASRREAGVPVERILPEVKAMVREASAYEQWFDADEALMGEVMGWATTAYHVRALPSQASGGSRGAGAGAARGA